MNAYELATFLEADSWYKLVSRQEIVDMLRQQAERIAELEKAIKDADEWLESGEGVSLCYYSFSDSNQNSIKVIKEITG